ncbi:ATP-binding cassette domain-containing protein [Pseudomonas sp. FSL R10-1350]|jgi:polar amino acid transport system ATP-binding protein|uniref:ATP-binding cassette domain-containing protein n=2 Tax=Pseudomonas TaxID=286 RepID=A0A6A7Z8B2_9PSED|nr:MULTISPECIES: amino acid ABC transporter ATP-binding protein [Pseudomonas]MQT33033.1 ATP-binding cassette domain-containing protein [Pseudomonas helleri]MQT37232.1 ATP-binding cassette domain-containing protein [Pseudomonas helleri]MQT47424.1 ATP-binding cassette domain-containing protein [Pseudomonas helleri]MQT59760.1 ATP-binding cassette domain-containing protein [Pseudomonas sp. FSL R10-0399]MQT90076.1 ATP-binding cassette domain-containing protein [Pseudomonas helleri]
MSQPLQIQLEDVYKSYGDQPILQGISLSVRRSEIACLIGPSGSGKSTLLRTLNALTPVDSGRIEVCGIRVDDPQLDVPGLRRHVGMIFQSYNLFPHLSVLDNITLAPIQVLGQSRQEAEAYAIELLAKVRLENKQGAFPGQLSGGQQQRVAIARSLAMRPDVMMFDEVTAALDPETVKEVLNTIRDVAASGMTCLIVTHEMRFAREIADTVYFTDGGRIVEKGDPELIFSRPADPRTQRFLERVL